MTRKTKDRVHGRPKHRPGGGCDTGRKCYPTKKAAEDASGTTATRCDRCRQFHADDDHPRRRR